MIPNGTRVAARVSGQSDSDEEQLWILAKVISYNSAHKKYTVEDLDQEDNKAKKYKLPRKHLSVLSKEFVEHVVCKKGTQVLAVYPDTTTFYAAIVTAVPSPSSNYMYSVKFEDDEDERGNTPSRRVSYKLIALAPEKEKKSSSDGGDEEDEEDEEEDNGGGGGGASTSRSTRQSASKTRSASGKQQARTSSSSQRQSATTKRKRR